MGLQPMCDLYHLLLLLLLLLLLRRLRLLRLLLLLLLTVGSSVEDSVLGERADVVVAHPPRRRQRRVFVSFTCAIELPIASSPHATITTTTITTTTITTTITAAVPAAAQHLARAERGTGGRIGHLVCVRVRVNMRLGLRLRLNQMEVAS